MPRYYKRGRSLALRRGRSRATFRRAAKKFAPYGSRGRVRGRRPRTRIRKFKKGAGRLMTRGMEAGGNPVLIGPMAPSRRRNVLCNPPMGRIYGSQGNLYQEKFTKITAVWTYNQISSNANPIAINLCASDFCALSASSPVSAYVPEFYQALHGWRTMTVLGLKVELFAEPQLMSLAPMLTHVPPTGILSTGAASLIMGAGRSFSTISGAIGPSALQFPISQYGSLYTIARPTPAVAIGSYTSQELALLDATYRSESFESGWRTTHLLKKPKRFFSRYTPFEYYKTAHEGVTDCVPNLGAEFTTPPSFSGTGVGNQYDTFVQYICYDLNTVNLGYTPPVATPYVKVFVRGTLYVRMVGRYPNDNTMYPAYMAPVPAELPVPSGNGS